jgi:hypothetical protein
MEMNDTQQSLTTWQWWAARRGRYNIGLIVSGIMAFICYATVVWTFEDRIPGAEVTIFTTLIQGLGYLVMIGVANVFFFLGPIAEQVIRPTDPLRFRMLTYRTGFWGSVSLPFLIPAFLLILVVAQPA